MRRRIYKGDHVNIANSLNNIGSVLLNLGWYKQSLAKFKESLAVRKRIYKGDHLDIVNSLNNIGFVLISLEAYQEAYNYSKQSYEMIIRLGLTSHPDFRIIELLFLRCTVILANMQIISDNAQEGYELYSLIGIREESVIYALHGILDGIDSVSTVEELDLAISCYEVLSKKLVPRDRGIKHNLACMYHAKAFRLYQENDIEQYNRYLSKSREVFESAINLESDEPISSSLCVEYAMFLVKHHDIRKLEEYRKIEALLNKAIGSKEEGSGLLYSKNEKAGIVSPLQELLNTRDSINVTPHILAYYLLVKVYHLHNEKEKAKEVLVNFAKDVMDVKKEEAEVPLNLLIPAYKELCFNFQARIYQEILDMIINDKQTALRK
jgi:tetratricopeptide (TPR) repeat protein